MAGGLKPGQKALVGAGRKKGTPNKNTFELRAAIAAACGADWDPLVAMSRIGKTGFADRYEPDEETGGLKFVGFLPVSEKTRSSCLKEVSEYIHAKRKAVELSGPDGDPMQMTLHNDLKAQDALQSLKQLALVDDALTD